MVELILILYLFSSIILFFCFLWHPELDAILNILVDLDGSIEDCVAAGFDRATAKKVEHLLYISEYKRFQSAPGTRLTKRAFWLDRRYPIVNRFRDQS